jgi:hypothetical protein
LEARLAIRLRRERSPAAVGSLSLRAVSGSVRSRRQIRRGILICRPQNQEALFLAFVGGFAHTVSMKSWAIGLSARFFKETTAIVRRGPGR